MITFALYLLKVIICSGILCGYYFIALRNKIFHRWNRFYLLTSVILSLSVPLIKVNIFQKAGSGTGTVIHMLQTITNSDEIVIEYGRNNGLQLSYENVIAAAYLLISFTFLIIFLLTLQNILKLKKRYPQTKLKGISFFSTDAKGTPFSFFNFIFWNNAIDLHSKQGHQIFNHEIAHIKEKHSYDKVFMNVVLLFFWVNPFFWLMQKELGMIHEFIADKEALEDSDINAFAEMVLQTVYPGNQFGITNNFFQSPLKRRLIMFTKNRNPKTNYVSRLLALTLAAFVFFAFTFKMKPINAVNYLGKKITVIIDAGHGGTDYGGIENDIKEKDLNLSVAKYIKELNTNDNLNIVLSRPNDELMTPQDRVKFAQANKADLFVSIHMDAESNKNNHSGVTILVPKNDNAYFKESKLLGSALIESFKNNYRLGVAEKLEQLERGIWVLNANQCPSVLIEPGFLSNQNDLSYLLKPENQQAIANNILKGIEKYAEQNIIGKSNNILMTSDTTPAYVAPPGVHLSSKAIFIVDGKITSTIEANAIDPSKIQSMNVLNGERAVRKYGEKAKNGAVEIIKKTENDTNTFNVEADTLSFEKSGNTLTAPVYFIDGKEASKNEMNLIPTSHLKSVTVLKGQSAINKYGEKGKNGVIEIVTHTFNSIQNDTIPDKLFTKVENEADFPGGRDAWVKYISNKLNAALDTIKVFTPDNYGTCLVKFIVNTDGSISHAEATTMKGTQLSDIAVNAIRNGPKWIPATQNNHVVASYRLQPVTLTQPK